jgi:HSP20 family protein
MRHLATRRPVGNLFSLHNEMEKIFGDLFASQESETNGESTSWMPTVDISETENGFEILAELPGVTESDVHVSVTDNLLTIKGEKQHEKETDDKNYHRVERRYGSFQRSFTLPRNVETTDIKAEFKDGVLTLNIPKAEEAKPTEIPITANT